MIPCDVLTEGAAYEEVLRLGMVFVGNVLFALFCGCSTANGKSIRWKMGVGLIKWNEPMVHMAMSDFTTGEVRRYKWVLNL